MSVRHASRAVPVASLAVLVCLALGAVLLALAMARYPGGTALDPTTVGHSFWFNFLCDLTNEMAVNGQVNRVGADLARSALALFGAALIGFWVLVPRLLDRRCGWGLATSIRALGLLSVGALALVPITTGWLHVAAVFASSLPGLAAGALALFATLRNSRAFAAALLGGAALVTGAVDAILYARSYMARPRVIPPALPILQRLALVLMLAWVAAVAWRGLTTPPRHQPGTNR